MADRAAAATEQAVDTRALAVRTDAEMVALTWRTVETSTYLAPFILAAVVFVVQSRIPGPSVWLWAAAMALVLAARFAILFVWKLRRPPVERYGRWGWYYVLMMAVSMAAWGSMVPLFAPRLEPLGQAFVLIVVGGLAGASVSQVAMRRLSAVAIPALPIGQMFATCLALGDDAMLALAALLACYWAYLAKVALEHHRSQRETVWLRFERAALADDLRRARDAAEAANEAKSAFLANVSHELRTPLNAVLGFSEMIKLGILGKEPVARQTEYAGMIHASGRHLLDLINDLLDLSKAEAGHLDLHEEPVALAPLIAACIHLLSPAADQAGVAVTGPDEAAADVVLWADDRKLRQILLNLLSNAMKFTPHGGRVAVGVRLADDGGLALSVADTGAGMTAQELEQVMLPFVQAGDVYNRQVQGTGLGLPLTKQLAELHGGRLAMRSTPGRGTEAIVHLPAERLQAALEARRGAA